jgi:NAD(P)-dependent dehydrogenase (short-subunit alcohol dehydrogenase family)
MLLKDKRIIVTGAASGIGAKTAQLLKTQGASVIGVDLNIPPECVDEHIRADLSDPNSIETAVENVEGRVDAVCNIAGLPPTKKRDLVIKVNFTGLRHFTELLIDKLSDNASIVNIASIAGFGWPEAAPQINALIALRDFDGVEQFCEQNKVTNEGGRSYNLSKEALIVWTMINRWTWRDRGIRMNCVSPGPVDTPILKDFLEVLDGRHEEDNKLMDRAGTPEDIAPVVAFLCSDWSAWIRGANIPCDGGMSPHALCNIHGYK